MGSDVDERGEKAEADDLPGMVSEGKRNSEIVQQTCGTCTNMSTMLMTEQNKRKD